MPTLPNTLPATCVLRYVSLTLHTDPGLVQSHVPVSIGYYRNLQKCIKADSSYQ